MQTNIPFSGGENFFNAIYVKAEVDTLYKENLYELHQTSLTCLVLTNSSDIYLERYAARRDAVASTPRHEPRALLLLNPCYLGEK